jgi:hypothetical protein
VLNPSPEIGNVPKIRNPKSPIRNPTEAALIFCGALTPADFQIAFQRLEEQGKELEAAQVDPVSGLAGKKPRLPATSPVS